MTTYYEIREQSAERPEDSRLLQVAATIEEAMQIAETYNRNDVAAFIRKVTQ